MLLYNEILLNTIFTLDVLPTEKEKRKGSKRGQIDLKGKVTNCTLKLNIEITLPDLEGSHYQFYIQKL